MNECTIAIVGAGTAGLAAALFLERDGHHVEIFEQFETPKPVGAGLMLQPTGLACLASLGLDQEIISQSQPIAHIDGRTTSGRKVLDIGYAELGPDVFGLGVHRATLFETLLNAVNAASIPLRTSTTIQDTTVSARGRRLVDADTATHGPFDLVIDASGARSQMRTRHADIRYVHPYPYAAVWGVAEQPDAWPWPTTLSQRFRTARNMLGVLPVGQRRTAVRSQVAFFWSLRASDYPAWRERGVAAWQADISEYWPEAGDLAAQFSSADDLTFATYPDVVLKRHDRDRMVFIGDSAHATSPQLGQGANLALADALELSRALRKVSTVPAALEVYQQTRKHHVQFYQIASRYLTPFFQSDSRVAPWVRDLTFGPMTAIPYLRREMVRTLAGVKTGLFARLDPGDWSSQYALDPKPRLAPTGQLNVPKSRQTAARHPSATTGRL